MKKIILSICLFVALATVSVAQTPAKKGGKPTPAVQQAKPENAATTATTPAPATATPAATTETKPATEAPACCKKKAATCCKKKSS